MNDIEIYPKFREVLPPLVGPELDRLEESILEEGIREPLRVWGRRLIDGHNRFEIAQKHDLPYRTVDMYFGDEDEAIEWILVNQLGRRNLEPHLRTKYIGQLYELQKKRKGEAVEHSKNGQFTVRETVAHTVEEPRTSEVIAKQFNVNEKTVRNAAKVHEAFEKSPPEIKKQFNEGKLSQKALVESVKPTVNEILDDEEHDETTRLLKDYGFKFQRVFREITELKDALARDLDKSNLDIRKIADNIYLLRCDAAQNDAHFLKKMVKCPACKGKKCAECKDSAYVHENRAAQITDRVEYIANGGLVNA